MEVKLEGFKRLLKRRYWILLPEKAATVRVIFGENSYTLLLDWEGSSSGDEKKEGKEEDGGKEKYIFFMREKKEWLRALWISVKREEEEKGSSRAMEGDTSNITTKLLLHVY